MRERQPLESIDPFDVKVMMLRHRITNKRVARKLRVTHQAVSLTLLGTRKALLPKIKKAVEKIISRPNNSKKAAA
jgi:transcriptional regulator